MEFKSSGLKDISNLGCNPQPQNQGKAKFSLCFMKPWKDHSMQWNFFNVLQSTLDFRNLQIVKFLDLVKFLLLTKFLLNKTLEIVKFLFIFESPIFRFSKVFFGKIDEI